MLRGLITRLWTARHLGGGQLRIAIALVMVVGASALVNGTISVLASGRRRRASMSLPKELTRGAFLALRVYE